MRGFGALILAMVALPVLAGLTALSCYDTSKPTPPCSVNSPNPGCPGWPHDMRAPDAGR